MVQDVVIDDAMIRVHTCLNELIALSENAEKIINLHNKLLIFELKTSNILTAYSFSKSIIWKTLERDFYITVYSQLSFLLQTMYEDVHQNNILPKLNNIWHNVNGTLNSCIGLELPEVVSIYKKMFSEFEGLESRINLLTLDDATIEQKAIDLIEQTASKYGHNIRLFDRLNELSGTRSSEILVIKKEVPAEPCPIPFSSLQSTNESPPRLSRDVSAPISKRSLSCGTDKSTSGHQS